MRMLEPLDDAYYMKKALQEAELAFEKGEVPVGAVIVVADRIIARAHNLTELLNDVTAHAEMQAITAASNLCAGALYWSQIKKIVFGASDEKRGCTAMGTTLHPKTQVIGGILEKECGDIVKRFFIEKRNLN